MNKLHTLAKETHAGGFTTVAKVTLNGMILITESDSAGDDAVSIDAVLITSDFMKKMFLAFEEYMEASTTKEIGGEG
jgi:hypothetical protein